MAAPQGQKNHIQRDWEQREFIVRSVMPNLAECAPDTRPGRAFVRVVRVYIQESVASNVLKIVEFLNKFGSLFLGCLRMARCC